MENDKKNDRTKRIQNVIFFIINNFLQYNKK